MIIPDDISSKCTFPNKDKIFQLISQAEERELGSKERTLKSVNVRSTQTANIVGITYEQDSWFGFSKKVFSLDIYADMNYGFKTVGDLERID